MSARDGTSARILCVDDNPDVAAALRLQLARAGHECVGILSDAGELLRVCDLECPDLVLLDLDMPGPDPLVVLAELAAMHPETRVIIVSGHVRRDLIERALEGGAWGYLSKTDTDPPIATAVSRVLAGEVVLGHDAQQVLGD